MQGILSSYPRVGFLSRGGDMSVTSKPSAAMTRRVVHDAFRAVQAALRAGGAAGVWIRRARTAASMRTFGRDLSALDVFSK
jgi:hypothetical protein